HHRTALCRTEIGGRVGPHIDPVGIGAPVAAQPIGQVGDQAAGPGPHQQFRRIEAARGQHQRTGGDDDVLLDGAGGVDAVDVDDPASVGGAFDIGDLVLGADLHPSGGLRGGDIGDVDGVFAAVVHTHRSVTVGVGRFHLPA